jgi:hypothetical protein
MKLMKFSQLLMLASVLLIVSCKKDIIVGSGSISTQTQNLGAFTEIEISNNCDIEVIKDSLNKVEFSEYENLIQYLKFEIVGTRLVVKTAPDDISFTNSKAKAKIYVSGALAGLFISGSGDIDIKSAFNTLNTCNLSGSGNIFAEATATSADMNVKISGSGDVDILKITSQTADCSISGSGDISLSVTNSLKATISGSGDIEYSGNPTVTKNISGSGSVRKL